MKVGRNQSCPCGSGRKYKHCCETLDQDAGVLFQVTVQDLPTPVPPEELARVAGADSWEADLVGGMELGPGGARTLTLVLGAGHVLYLEALERPPEDRGRQAALLGRAVGTAARATGAAPREVRVRTGEIAGLLREHFPFPGVPVTAAPDLPEVDAFVEGAVAGMDPVAAAPADVVVHERWREWGWPRDAVAELFRAAAAYWRAAPWESLDNAQVLSLRSPAGSAWTACVMGNAGIEEGLALYRDRDDLLRQMETHGPAEAMTAPRGPVLSLTYGHRAELSRRAVKEVIAAGWEVAGPDAYPELIAINPPAEGLPPDWAAELAGALWAIPPFVERHRPVLESELDPAEPVLWADPATGIAVEYHGRVGEAAPPLWEPPDALASALPAGPSADPAAALDPHDPEALERGAARALGRFRAALEEKPMPRDRVERTVADAGRLLAGLSEGQAIPLAACTELDLRLVLYDWLPRRGDIAPEDARRFLTSVRRFFRHLERREGLSFPWADAILRDRASFEARLGSVPDGAWWDAEVADWRGEVYDDLDARVLIPNDELSGGDFWGPTMGPVEAALHRELDRRWLLWREQAIAGGLVEPETVWEALSARQRGWERAPHPGHEGRSPAEAVARERR